MPRRRAPLDVLTLNRGDHAKSDAIARAITRSEWAAQMDGELRGHALVALQEMHDSQRILDQLEDDGLGVWRGNLEDSEASPVVWDPAQFDVRHTLSFHLLAAGRRAGKYNMAKTLNVVVGKHLASGRRIAFGSVHNIQTQYLPGRRRAAEQLVRNVVDKTSEHFRCVTIIGGDWNAKPDGPSLAPVRRARGWDYDQLHDPFGTHGRRPIDGFAFTDRDPDPGVLTYVRHRPVDVRGTDHRGNSARFLLTVKETR